MLGGVTSVTCSHSFPYLLHYIGTISLYIQWICVLLCDTLITPCQGYTGCPLGVNYTCGLLIKSDGGSVVSAAKVGAQKYRWLCCLGPITHGATVKFLREHNRGSPQVFITFIYHVTTVIHYLRGRAHTGAYIFI